MIHLSEIKTADSAHMGILSSVNRPFSAFRMCMGLGTRLHKIKDKRKIKNSYKQLRAGVRLNYHGFRVNTFSDLKYARFCPLCANKKYTQLLINAQSAFMYALHNCHRVGRLLDSADTQHMMLQKYLSKQ